MRTDASGEVDVERGRPLVGTVAPRIAPQAAAESDHADLLTITSRPEPGLPEAPAAEVSALGALDHPRLVLSEGFVGIDRRQTGVRALLARSTFGSRRRLLRLDVLSVLAVLAVVIGAVLFVGTRTASHSARPERATAGLLPADQLGVLPESAATPTARTVPTVPTTVPVASTTPTTVAQAPAAASPAATAPPATAPPATVPPTTPEAMGAAALALVRYPWQQIPGYSIRFLPIADAPSPGFYGNTDFTWGHPGGVSTLYVYPGESIDRLAGITAFEIGHEVDGGYVEPQGGHAQISAILGVNPPSWAPECDCAEQGYLSGWYAAAFSDYWSPGVGSWSTLAPPPSGAVLTAVEPWLDPRLS